MKIKSRNLLTAILALLCAVTVALGVSFALPKNEIKSAVAATATPTLMFGSEKFWHIYAINTAGGFPVTVSYRNDMSTTNTCSQNFGLTTNANSVSAKVEYSSIHVTTANVIPVILNLKVPAYTAYTVDMTYAFAMSSGNGRGQGLVDKWTSAESVADINANADFVLYTNSIWSQGMQSDCSGQTHWGDNSYNQLHGSHTTNNSFT